MPRATICVDAGAQEQVLVDEWFERWRDRLPFASDNEGCGCCVDLYRVDAPQEALEELPANVLIASEWSSVK